MARNNTFSLVLKILIPIALLMLAGYFGYNIYLGMAYPLKYEPLIKKYSKANDVNPYLLSAIIREESRFNHDVQSKKGAIGLMQIMPKTAVWISKKSKMRFHPESLSDPEVNIKFGSWYYGYLKKRYGSEKLALSAYNAGTTNVDQWVAQMGPSKAKKLIPFDETKNFVKRVTDTAQVYKGLYEEELR